MQIDRYENILFNVSTNRFDSAEKTGTNKPEKSESKKNKSLDSSINAEYASIIERSLQIEDIDYHAVRQAQNELETGKIDDLDAAIIAAENIMAFGI